jgi:small conductance mechanosensitive channel
MDPSSILQTITTVGVQVGLKILGAIVVWLVGRWLIRMTLGLVSRGLAKKNMWIRRL